MPATRQKKNACGNWPTSLLVPAITVAGLTSSGSFGVADTGERGNFWTMKAPVIGSTRCVPKPGKGVPVPRGPKGERRPVDVNARAVMIAKIAAGEIDDTVPPPESEGKDPAAVALGRKGGKARAAGMSAKKRKDIAKKAAATRWGKYIK